MSLPRHILQLFFILMISFVSRYFSLPIHDPPYNYYLDETFGYGSYDSQAYPSYLNTIDDGEFKDFINLRTQILSLENVDTSPKIAKIVSVDDLGAKGDGADDTEAFMDAWKEACSNTGTGAILVVPKGKTYRLKPVRFSGPCKAFLTVQIYGTLEASDDQSDYKKDSRHWIVFDNVQNLLVEGGGSINGNGKIWWENSCKIDKSLPCKEAPTALTFYKSKNLVVNNLNIEDAQQMHVSFQKCKNVLASNLVVTSPEHSPNTDGIHVTDTQNIRITSSTIGTGDDCISIVSGSQYVEAEDITCGPGHGISIGSLGKDNSKAYVSGVTVNGAKISGTRNGVRIKTWQGGSGYASNIKFLNIDMFNVTNPIIIDQNYCDQDKPCKEQSSAVQVKNVLYKNIEGTSASEVAVKFDCSKSYPCEGIVLQDVNLRREVEDEAAKAECNNVDDLAQTGVVSPRCP
ncbi:Polygalacturonase [Melia azedarach]|uniref:Polygalacturonase n=1 Tax=Melia azedarach TaxID=155640 RepID=A0ACC1X5F7_MELAZ|nr:Polygalacturonase [Melia azedarach]